ncbi:hypothetical protein ACQJBY_005637 [Aegilops geniculata]
MERYRKQVVEAAASAQRAHRRLAAQRPAHDEMQTRPPRPRRRSVGIRGALVLPTGVARAWPSAWPSHCPTAHAADGRLGDREDCLQPRCGMEDRGRRRSRPNDAALDSHPRRSAGPEAMALY